MLCFGTATEFGAGFLTNRNANRTRDKGRLALVSQLSGFLVDRKYRYRVRICSSGQQPLSIRGQVKVAWPGAVNRGCLHSAKEIAFGLKAKNRNGVVTAIGGVDEFPIGMHPNFGSTVKHFASFLLIAECRFSRHLLHRAVVIDQKATERHGKFVEHKRELSFFVI